MIAKDQQKSVHNKKLDFDLNLKIRNSPSPEIFNFGPKFHFRDDKKSISDLKSRINNLAPYLLCWTNFGNYWFLLILNTTTKKRTWKIEKLQNEHWKFALNEFGKLQNELGEIQNWKLCCHSPDKLSKTKTIGWNTRASTGRINFVS